VCFFTHASVFVTVHTNVYTHIHSYYMNFDQGWCPRGLCLHDPRDGFPVWVQQNMGVSSWQYKKSFIPKLGQKLPILLVFRSNCLFGLAYLTRNLRLFVSGMVENHNLMFASSFLTGPFSFLTTCIRYGWEPQSIIWLLQFGTSQPILKSDLCWMSQACEQKSRMTCNKK